MGERSVRWRQSGLPVVRVNELGSPRDGALTRREERSRAREQAEAQRIVVPVGAAGILVRTLAIVERGTIDDPCRNTLWQLSLEQPCFGKACQGVDSSRLSRARQRCDHGGIPRQDHARVEPDLPQRDRKRPGDVA